MTRFQYCLVIVLGHEGGLSNHLDDHGGSTNFGVTQATYTKWLKSQHLPSRPVSDIHESEVEAIYYGYWKDAKCDRLPDGLDLVVFDCAINSGSTRAIKLLQKALGIDEDGVFGAQTLGAIREEILAGSLPSLITQFLAVRASFYQRLVARDASQQVFLKGWLARLDHLQEVVT